MKPELVGVSRSALITLCARARESQHPRSVLSDPSAEEVLRTLDHDFSTYERSPLTLCGLAVRARTLDDWTRRFLETATRPRVVSLGCGLDDRSRRVGGEASWLDVDLAPMEELWRRFHSDSGRCFVAGSLDDEAWVEGLPEGESTVVLAEGVLMYVAPERVRRLFELLRRRLPRAEVWADVLSPLAARTGALQPAVGGVGNRFSWSLKAGRAPEGFELVEELSLFQPRPERWGGWRLLGRLPLVRSGWRLLRLRARDR